MGVYTDIANRLMAENPVAAPTPTPTQEPPAQGAYQSGKYQAIAQRLMAQNPPMPPETQSQRLHRSLLGDRSPRPSTMDQITQRTDARLQHIQQKPVYAPALMGQPLQSDPTVATEMWNRPDLTPTEQGAAYFGSAVSKGIPFFRHPARRNYGGEVQTDFGDSTLANVAEKGTELGVGIGVNLGEQILASNVGGLPTMIGAVGASAGSDAALVEQQKRVQRGEAPGTLGEDVSRGVGITRSGPDDTNLARGMRALSVPVSMASTLLGVKLSRNVAAMAKEAGGVTPAVVRRAALATLGGGATSAVETIVQKAGQGDHDLNDPDIALSFFISAAADAIGARGDVSGGLTQRAIADLDPTVDPSVRPEVGTEIPPQYHQDTTELSTDLPPAAQEVPRPPNPMLPTDQPIQQAAVNMVEESPLIKGSETQPPVAEPLRPSDTILEAVTGKPSPARIAQQAAAAEQPAQAGTGKPWADTLYRGEREKSERTDAGDYGSNAIYSTGDESRAAAYAKPVIGTTGKAGSIIKSEVSLVNPLVFKTTEEARAFRESIVGPDLLDNPQSQTAADLIEKEIRARGHDGVVVYDSNSNFTAHPDRPFEVVVYTKSPEPSPAPAAATPPPEPPAPKIPITKDDNSPENDATYVRQALEERGRKYGFNALDGIDDDPKKIPEVFERAAREGFGEVEKVRDAASRVYEQIDKGEEPTLTPKEIAGFSMRVEQLDNKIKRLEKFTANKMTSESDRQLFQNEIDQAVEEMAFIAPARVAGAKTASFSMNMLRAYRKADDGGIGVLNRKLAKMEKDAVAKNQTILPEKINELKRQIKETERIFKESNKEIVRLGEERSNLAAEEAAAKLPNEKGRPNNTEETMTRVDRILKSNNGCKTFYGM